MDNQFEHHLSDEVQVHPSAIVAKGCELGKGVVVGPFAVIGAQVKLGDGVRVDAHALIEGRTSIGAGTRVFSHASVGTDPQDLKYRGEPTQLEIGENNSIREYANISIGTESGGGVTRLGGHNRVMAYTHIAHDCQVGNHCIFANGVQIAGHVVIDDYVVFGGMSGGHQFCRFGRYAMVGAGAIVVQDVAPYLMVQGDRAEVSGLNIVGLRRAGIKGKKLSQIKEMFRLTFHAQLTLEDALVKIKEEIADSQEKATFVSFLEKSRRGICR